MTSILTTDQVAAQLGISRSSVQRLRKAGKLTATGFGRGGIRYDQAEVNRYVQETGFTYILDESASVTPLDALLVTAQRKPRRVSYHATSHSPTESLGSRQAWARREVWLLRGVHAIAEPTHFATLQWRGVIGPGELRRFDRVLSQAVRRYVERSGHEFSLYAVKELNVRDRVHSHVLIRSDVPAVAVGEVLSRLVLGSSFRRAVVTECVPIRDLRAVERYITKDLNAVRQGAKSLRLFEPGFVRHRTSIGYFPAGWTLGSLRESGRSFWLREIQAAQQIDEQSRPTRRRYSRHYPKTAKTPCKVT